MSFTEKLTLEGNKIFSKLFNFFIKNINLIVQAYNSTYTNSLLNNPNQDYEDILCNNSNRLLPNTEFAKSALTAIRKHKILFQKN